MAESDGTSNLSGHDVTEPDGPSQPGPPSHHPHGPLTSMRTNEPAQCTVGKVAAGHLQVLEEAGRVVVRS